MFQVKICGVTNVEDALMAVEAGADAIGLNFYPPSPRYLVPEQAARIAQSVRSRALRVGVLLSPTEEEALELASRVGLDAVQLHGNEPAEFAARLSLSLPVFKAFRIGPAGLAPVFDYLRQFREAGGVLRAVLFDAHQPGQPGGTGKTADWDVILGYPSEDWHPPFVLAGGLTPDNVAAAILRVRPSAVDTASGVEDSPGRKSALLVARFVHEARAALTATH